jgi:uncharacterized protein
MVNTVGDINLSQKKSSLLSLLVIVLIVLFSALVVLSVVEIQNKIKEGHYIGQDIESRNNISVQATGEVYIKPDIAMASFSVVNEKKTVAGAMAENSEKMNAIIEALKNEGIEEKDLRTTVFRVYPRYEWYDDSEYYREEGQRVLVGYEITQTLEVKIRDMERIGEIIETATSEGANQVGNISFTLDNEDAAKDEARSKAIEEAKDKAEVLASQLGVRLVRITNFTESLSPTYKYADYDWAESPESSAEMGAAPSIETGENKISVTVHINYEIN